MMEACRTWIGACSSVVIPAERRVPGLQPPAGCPGLRAAPGTHLTHGGRFYTAFFQLPPTVPPIEQSGHAPMGQDGI